MKYGLPQIGEEEFERLHQFVRAIFDQGHQRFTPELVTIGTDIAWFPTCHQPYLVKSDSLGVTMEDYDQHRKEFHIWITPSYKEPMFKFYMTLAHELCHGYAGLTYGHNAHWRRWFYRVMYHLIEAEMVPQPEDNISCVLYSVERVYNKNFWADNAMVLINESMIKAKQEHSQVLDSYWRRLA